jgi:aldose 1-epimerase
MPAESQPVTLENEHWRLSLLPRLGASPTSLQAKLGGAWTDIMRPTAPDLFLGNSSSKFSSYTLAPWSNRIPNGRFVFNGQSYELQINVSKERTARHGDVQDRPWQVTRDDLSLRCEFVSPPDVNFPFPFAMTMTHCLSGEVYRLEMHIKNLGDALMPVGFGIHPYFLRRGQTPRLCFAASGVYLTDQTNVPQRGAEAISEWLKFSQPKPLESRQIDHVFAGWDGSAALMWQDCTLHIKASEVFGHFVVFTGAPDDTIALEPITHATNAFNLAAAGVDGTGHQVLEPGRSLSGTIELWLGQP